MCALLEFWDFMQHRMVVSYWSFWTFYWSQNTDKKLPFYAA